MFEGRVPTFEFPDGRYSFWCARAPGREARIVFRVKETGEEAWLTPHRRLHNLVHEVIAARDPEAVETYERFTDIYPADMTTVAAWFVGHKIDLEDFLSNYVVFAAATPEQERVFALSGWRAPVP